MLKIGVLVSGGGTNLQALIDSVKSGYIKAEIAAVVSSRKSAYALERARNNGIDAVFISKKKYGGEKDAYEREVAEYFLAKGVGLVVTAGFNTLMSEYFTQVFKNKIINVHPTLIPSFCGKGFYGLAVHESVLERGVKLSGATVHFVNDIPDGGPIISQKAVPVLENDTPEILQKRIMVEAEQILLPEAVKLFAEGKITVRDNKVFISE